MRFYRRDFSPSLRIVPVYRRKGRCESPLLHVVVVPCDGGLVSRPRHHILVMAKNKNNSVGIGAGACMSLIRRVGRLLLVRNQCVRQGHTVRDEEGPPSSL